MKRCEAVSLAKEIAETLNFSASMTKNVHGEKKPKFFDFLIFGSTTRKSDEESVGDLDMILFDNGQLSKDFMIDCQEPDWYSSLRGNLQCLLCDFANELYGERPSSDFSYRKAADLLAKLQGRNLKVDLHILPVKFLQDRRFRGSVAKKHKDPIFFKNCFSQLLRLKNNAEFVPVKVQYFEKKYRCNLKDLK